MDFQSFAGRVHVDPKPENLQINGGGNSLYIGFQSLPATAYTVTLDAGVAWIIGDNIQLDVSVGQGLNGDAPRPFVGVGVSMRFGRRPREPRAAPARSTPRAWR